MGFDRLAQQRLAIGGAVAGENCRRLDAQPVEHPEAREGQHFADRQCAERQDEKGEHGEPEPAEPFVAGEQIADQPFGGETENGFRKFCAKFASEGLKCSSAGTGPAQVAVAIKTAIAALEGEVVPQSVKLPLAIVEDPNFKEGEDYFPDQSDNFFVGNSFPTCGINFTAQEIMGQSKENQ